MSTKHASKQWGASLEAWHHWSVTLGLHTHLLPVVANPRAKVSPDSAMQSLGKTPSRYNFRGEVSGFAKWTEVTPTMRQIGEWEVQPDYGICVQAREIRAIDIDVHSKAKASRIMALIEAALPLHFFPERYREDTGKRLLAFRYAGDMPKRVVPVDGGIIEFLGDGQQWIADSTHIDKDGKATGRYLWRGGWPQDFPLLDDAELEALWDSIVSALAIGEAKIARLKRAPGTHVDRQPRPGLADPLGQFLLANWEVREEGRDGEIYVRCPWHEEHSSDSGPTESVYYVAGTGGYERGHFKSLHAHCMGRTDLEFADATGFTASTFPIVEEDVDHEPATELEPSRPQVKFMLDKKNFKEAREYNFVAFLSEPELCKRIIAWDDFSASMIWAPVDNPGQWREFRDSDYSSLCIQMDRNGFVPVRPATIRTSVLRVAENNAVDLGIEWAKRLPEWDGVPRIARFLPDYLLTEDSDYTRAVGEYMWTAHAGRLLEPGIKADMALVWYGRQGARKSASILAMSPSIEMWTEIKVGHRNADTARSMRGRLVVELAEMSSIKGRDVDDVKGWVAAQVEEWVPKYLEFVTKFKRRCILHGSTNGNEFLVDPTGERRWLPFTVCRHHTRDEGPDEGYGEEFCDVDRIAADRDQLWAEGIALFKAKGIVFREAEQLAKAEHVNFSEIDMWEGTVVEWLITPDQMLGTAPAERPYGWGIEDVLVSALGQRIGQTTKADAQRCGKLLAQLRCTKKRVRGKGWRYCARGGVLELFEARKAQNDEMFQ